MDAFTSMGDASGGAKRKPATSTTIPGLAVKKQKRSTVSFEDEIRINEKLSRVHDKEQSEDVLTCAVCRASGRRMDILRYLSSNASLKQIVYE